MNHPHLDRILALKTGAIQVLESITDKELVKEKISDVGLLKENESA